MLNISNNSVKDKMSAERFSTLGRVEAKSTSRVLINLLKWSVMIIFCAALLPWTQNVRSTGTVTTYLPEHKPQTIHSVIAGRIDKWYIREGMEVKKGDTIALISEIKDDYFDDQLLPRTKNQLDLKKQTAEAYGMKEGAQDKQMQALIEQRELQLEQAKIKLGQARLKVQNDSIAYEAAKLNASTAGYQYDRMDSLYRQGLKSLVDLESRRLKRQETLAYEVEAKNKWLNSKNELINLKLEISNVRTKFDTDYAKVLSEKLTTSSSKYDAESMVNKLENQYSNYQVRSSYYYITAPQSGYVTETFVSGIGETIKEGQNIVSIMPADYDLAVEIFVDPIDLPLMHIGEHVRVQFDGWPAIVFSGWPNASYGTYGGEIYAIDQFTSPNGKYRLLVKPDEIDHPWPDALRYGAGANAMILLNDVPIWYELWRKVNAFPPNYYTPEMKSEK